MDRVRAGKAVFAGVVGTAAMTVLMLMAPVMGFPPMNVGSMLGSVMGGSAAIGWVAHFMIGAILALAFAALFAARLPGPLPIRGMIYGLLPWLAAQVVVMPMMGVGFFSGSLAAALGSLMGHLVYGAVVGVVYGAHRREGTVAVAPAG
jgi:uncharacterized membrane protein YagU involved in acid resistance